jgi:hypothetical protein
VGFAGEEPTNLGGLFFRYGDAKSSANRLMVVRVVGMQQVNPVRTEVR